MNKEYYDAVVKMEEMGVNNEYIQGWQGGYLLNLSLIHISEPTRLDARSRMPSSA